MDLYYQDMLEAGYTVGRTRLHFLQRIRSTLGQLKLSELTRLKLIEFGKSRAKEGAGPATIGGNFSDIQSILLHAEAVHGVRISHEEFRLARLALRKLGLICKSVPRRRRPTVDEINQLIGYFEIVIANSFRWAGSSSLLLPRLCALERSFASNGKM
jgi:hypothetical protein